MRTLQNTDLGQNNHPCVFFCFFLSFAQKKHAEGHNKCGHVHSAAQGWQNYVAEYCAETITNFSTFGVTMWSIGCALIALFLAFFFFLQCSNMTLQKLLKVYGYFNHFLCKLHGMASGSDTSLHVNCYFKKATCNSSVFMFLVS